MSIEIDQLKVIKVWKVENSKEKDIILFAQFQNTIHQLILNSGIAVKIHLQT